MKNTKAMMIFGVYALATMEVRKKNERIARTKGLRPKIWESEAKLGWKTVEVRRKEVPDQKASMAVPPRS